MNKGRMRRAWLVAVALVLCVCGVASAAGRPNIVFIFTDDHAPHAIGAYGGWLARAAPTPNIDKLAERGVLFTNSFCANSICGPSRANILTGKHSHLNGFVRNGNKFDGSQTTFPKLLRRAGYTTAMIGKWHLRSEPTGFDYWHVLPGQGSYYNPDLISAEGKRRYTGHCTDVVTDLALKWLSEGRDKGKPFMLMMQHKAPHRSWLPATRHLSLFADEDLPEAPTLFDDWSDNASAARNQKMTINHHMRMAEDLMVTPPLATTPDKTLPHMFRRMNAEQRAAWDEHFVVYNEKFRAANLGGKDLWRWKYQRYLKNYLRCIAGVDESVGRLVAYLEANGLAENTIVIYSSDQGFYLGDHGWYDKRWMYEESLRMPLVVSWPGVTPRGKRVDQMVQNIDYAQTFLEIAGADAPKEMQGASLVPLLRGESPSDWRKSIYYHYHEYPGPHAVARHVGIRTERYKLMHFYQLGEWEFYDLKTDPDELNNRYGDPAVAATVAELKAQLEALRKHYKDETDLSAKP